MMTERTAPKIVIVKREAMSPNFTLSASNAALKIAKISYPYVGHKYINRYACVFVLSYSN